MFWQLLLKAAKILLTILGQKKDERNGIKHGSYTAREFPLIMQVLGKEPYKTSCTKSTEELSREIIDHFAAPDSVYSIYVRHLALMVRSCNGFN